MTTLKDIKKAIANILVDATKCDLMINDIEEPVIRPSFKVTFNNCEIKKYNGISKQIEIDIDIFYFCKDEKKYTIENLEMHEKLSDIFFESIVINNNIAVVSNFNSSEENGVLCCSFSLEMFEVYDNNYNTIKNDDNQDSGEENKNEVMKCLVYQQ